MRNRRSRYITSALMALLALLTTGVITGCGTLSGPSSDGAAGGQTISHISPAPSVTPPTTNSPAPQGAVTGKVTLALDKTHYGTSDLILVTVQNGYGQPIYAADHQTACTTATLQRQESGVWQAMNLCRLKTPTVLAPLAATTTTTLRLAGDASGWSPGTYRVVFTYQGNEAGASGVGGTLTTPNFTIS